MSAHHYLWGVASGLVFGAVLMHQPAKPEVKCQPVEVMPGKIEVHLLSPTGKLEVGAEGIEVKSGGTLTLGIEVDKFKFENNKFRSMPGPTSKYHEYRWFDVPHMK